ncbi:substrate-binding periplasmic protein [Oricola indica]|uniref:substrate-binding periplasmic protein n=1 Tax=Oricola indica TaxID=2872591 RepID=UPI001CC0B159|nr:transporter substrate-binding domain-containing protein [Oricola indica]
MQSIKTISAISLAALMALTVSTQAQEKFRVGADVGFAPHVMAKPDGGVEGFNVDLIEAVAEKMGATVEIVNVPYSGIFADMDAGNIDFIIAPTTANADRASKVLLSEGYLNNDYRFIVKAGGAKIEKMEDLKGLKIAVNRGNSNDVWLSERQDQYGYEIVRFGSNPDALQAVISGQADANLSGATVATYLTKATPALEGSYVVKTGFTYFHPFKKGDEALRDRFEAALECVKLEGTVAAIYEKWFGEPARPDEAAYRVVYGYGEPGLEGYDPTAHMPNCGD